MVWCHVVRFPELTRTNDVTSDAYDFITETPEFKVCAVKITKSAYQGRGVQGCTTSDTSGWRSETADGVDAGGVSSSVVTRTGGC